MFTVSEVRSNECPVSVTTKQSDQLVQTYHRSRSLQEVGVSTFRANGMPIPLADAFVILSSEANRYENAARDYEQYDAKHANDQNPGGKQ
jgi:hypothetical protein